MDFVALPLNVWAGENVSVRFPNDRQKANGLWVVFESVRWGFEGRSDASAMPACVRGSKRWRNVRTASESRGRRIEPTLSVKPRRMASSRSTNALAKAGSSCGSKSPTFEYSTCRVASNTRTSRASLSTDSAPSVERKPLSCQIRSGIERSAAPQIPHSGLYSISYRTARVPTFELGSNGLKV